MIKKLRFLIELTPCAMGGFETYPSEGYEGIEAEYYTAGGELGTGLFAYLEYQDEYDDQWTIIGGCFNLFNSTIQNVAFAGEGMRKFSWLISSRSFCKKNRLGRDRQRSQRLCVRAGGGHYARGLVRWRHVYGRHLRSGQLESRGGRRRQRRSFRHHVGVSFS